MDLFIWGIPSRDSFIGIMNLLLLRRFCSSRNEVAAAESDANWIRKEMLLLLLDLYRQAERDQR